MENNESNLKSQQTGGLKLMTVFIAVLALHVVVIGGFTVYHLMSGGSTDADLVTDKAHKGVKVSPESSVASDGQLPDTTGTDKSTSPAIAPATPAPASTTPAPSTDSVATDTGSTPAPAPASTPTPAPAETPAPATEPTASTPSGPVITPPAGSPAPATATAAPAPEIASEPAPASGPNEEAASGTPYVVKSHDSLARIAHQHHLTVAKLKAANSLKSDLLQIGQKLTIPAKTAVASTAATPNTPAVASDDSTTVLSDPSPAPAAKPVATTPHDQAIASAPVHGHHLYTVVKGDTLTRIAHKFHTTSTALMAANNIADARKMKIGQKLRIPSQEPRSANVSPAPVQQPDRIEPRATPSAQLANFTL
jgi:LysM repeat protein